MARLWQWEARAAAWDAELDAQLEAEIAAEHKKILRTELALQHKRVELLNRKAQQLAAITDNPEHVWLLDVKSIGTGPDAERADLVQFNDAAFKELREYLTDIADEMGECIKKHEAAITQLPPLTYGVSEDEEGCDPRLPPLCTPIRLWARPVWPGDLDNVKSYFQGQPEPEKALRPFTSSTTARRSIRLCAPSLPGKRARA